MRRAVLASLLLAVSAAASAADNLLPWADFKPAPAALPTSWTYNSVKLIAVQQEEGATAVRITALDDALVLAKVQVNAPVGAKRLIVTGRVKAENLISGEKSSHVGRVALQVFSGGKRVAEKLHTVSGTGAWQPITLQLEAPAEYDKVEVHFGSMKAKAGFLTVSDLALKSE